MKQADNLKMDVVLSRTLDLRTGGAIAARSVHIEIARPLPETNGNWCCAYRVTGLPEIAGEILQINGVDGVQALNNAMVALEGLLCGTDAAREARLTWLGKSTGFLR